MFVVKKKCNHCKEYYYYEEGKENNHPYLCQKCLKQGNFMIAAMAMFFLNSSSSVYHKYINPDKKNILKGEQKQ